MNTPERLILTLLVMALAITVLSAPVLAADPTTEVHLVKYANDEETVLNETTVDYHWMRDNLPVQGDGVTRYYMEGPVFDGEWEKVHPNEPYDGWDTNEDVQMAFLYKGDLGPVKGTNVTDLCSLVGGASPNDTIKIFAKDGWARAYPYSQIYEPDPRQGPAVLCWYCANDSGPYASPDQRQGQGYPDTGYKLGMRLIFFADNSTNPWGWHAFGNNDMRECWNETYWNKGGQYWSVVGTSPKWVSEIRIYSQEPAVAPVANFTVNATAGPVPLTVAFNDTSTPLPTSWSWDFGDGTTSTEKNPVHTYTTADTYDVTLTATNAVGSDTTEPLVISATETGDSATTQVHIIKYASDGTTVLNEKTVDYQWMEENLPVLGDGTTHYYLQDSVSEVAWHDVHPYKRYNSWDPDEDVESTFIDLGAVKGTNLADICNTSGGMVDGDTVTLVGADNASLTFPYDTVFEPDAAQGPIGLCWQCDGDDTGADYSAGISLAYFADNSTNPGNRHIFGDTDMKNCWEESDWTYNASLPSTANASLDRISEVLIYSQEPPVSPAPSFTANVTTGTPPLTVAFTDASSGSPSVWSWDFGDGATSTEQNPVHTYTAPATYPGVYTVKLSTTNGVGTNTTTKTGYITVTAGYANFTANRTGGLAPLTVAFTDTTTHNPTSWLWSFGDENTSSEQNPVHTYTTVGTYNVTLTATGAFGSDTKVTSRDIDQIRVLSKETIGTTTLHIVRFASDNTTVLNETTVDYHWLEANLPVYGDGVTRYYMEGPVFEGVWESVHPDKPYDAWDPDEDVQMAFLYKGDLGAVKGTGLRDICDYIGGSDEGCKIGLNTSDGYKSACFYNDVYNLDPRQGPPVICWYSGEGSGPAAQKQQGVGYPDTGYQVGMRLIYFADNSTNPWGWHAFGNTDMKECWTYMHFGGSYPSAVGTSAKWVDEVFVYTTDPATAPTTNFTANVTSGSAPLSVNFTDTSGISPYAWSWDFGDGMNSTDRNPVHTYTAVGTYNVTLTATNAVGSATKTGQITVSGGSGSETEMIWGPYFTGTTGNLTIVNWKTDRAATGTVEFADDAFYTAHGTYDRSVADTTATDLHHVTLDNLTPDTLYHYRVTTGDTATPDHTFRTFPEDGGFTFIVYGDTQLPANVEIVADRIADENPLFVLHTGDLVNTIEDDDEVNNFFESSRKMLANTTLYTTLGNHEYYTTTSPSPTTGNSIYNNITGMSEWYSFNCSDAHFAVLDDNNDRGADITQESAWLKDDLSTDAVWKFVANHHPPYSSVTGRAGGWLYPRQWWGQTMRDDGVAAVFNGHVHAYERYLVDNITYLVTGTGAGSLCSLGSERPVGYQTSLTHTLGYTKITVYPNGTAAGEFVEVARLDPNNSSNVLEVYPAGTVYDTYTMTSPFRGADLAVASLDVPTGVTAGTSCTVNATVENLGTVASDACQVTLSAGDTIIGTDALGTLAPGAAQVVSFSWMPSAAGETNLTLAIDPEATVQDVDRTNNNLTVTVTVASGSGSDKVPVAGFTASATSGTAPLTVVFTDTSSNAPTSWTWTFGDKTTSIEQNPTHTYTAAGTYTVNLTATNAAGSNSTTASIVVTSETGPANATLTLYQGWNFVSTPKTLANGEDTIGIFKDVVDTAGHSVLLYNGTRGWEAMSSQEAFEPLAGIWIYANGTYEIPLHFAAGTATTPPVKHLDEGWNAIGFTDTVPEATVNTLRSVEGKWSTVIGFDAEDQTYDVSIIRGAEGRHGETREMSPMQGYWIFMNEADTLGAIDV